MRLAKKVAKSGLKRVVNSLGFELRRLSESPTHHFLGLRHRRIQTVIDVGANDGQYARKILSLFPGATVHCFEPLPETFKSLRQWATQQTNQIHCYNLALGDARGSVTLYHHVDHDPSSSLLRSTALCESLYPATKKQKEISVELATLDTVMSSTGSPLDREILIKLDVQGYEDRVVMGGRQTLQQAVACIAEISLNQLYHSQPNLLALLTSFDELGYRYAGNLNQFYASDGHVVFIDALFVNERCW